ncbi:MAG: S8 family serine peptidase [Solirubrobacteraceae bacterium]
MPRSFALVLLVLLIAAAPAAAADPRRGEQWNLDLIEADGARAVTTGAGATVAVIDSGVQADHPDLAGRIGPGYDVVQRDSTPQDGDGHGTHVMGIIGAATGNGIGVESVAPGATLMPVRVLGDGGGGSIDDVAKGIDWAREHGADVINLSLGSDVPLVGAGGGDGFDAAIRRAIAAGIVVVAAAGNNGVPVCEQPAASDGLLCVGAVDKRRQRSFFSSFGSGLGLVAPGGAGATATGMDVGEDVLSTYAGSSYRELAGTSQAAPHVSGVAALLVSRGVRGQAAVRRLLATATDLGPPGVDSQYGAGLVDARAAVAGLGGGPGAPGAGGAGAPAAGPVRVFVHVKRRQVGRRGIRVRVRAAHAGRVRVRVMRRGHVVARGSRVVRAGRASTVVARLTRRGRRLAAFTARVRVRLPGERKWRTRRVPSGPDERQRRLGSAGSGGLGPGVLSLWELLP